MTVATRLAAQALRRVSFGFATDGSHAACLASADGSWFAESWGFDPDTGEATPTALPLAGNRSEGLRSQLVSLPDGRVLICRHQSDRHDLAVLAASGGSAAEPGDPRAPVSPAVECAAGTMRTPGLRLIPLPVPPGHPATRPGTPVAVALGTDARPVTTVWLVRADGSAPQPILEIPGLFGGGVWLDHDGRLLALDRVHGGVLKTVVLDLAGGSVTPLLELSERSNDRLVLFDPGSQLIVVRSDAPGEDRLGWGVLGALEPLRFPECLHPPGLVLRPLATEPVTAHRDGAAVPPEDTRVAVQLDRGAASTLAVWQPAGGRLEPLPVPPGRLGAVAHWSAAGLRMPYSSPDHPAAMATMDVDTLLRLGAGALAPAAVALPLQLAPLQQVLPQPTAGPGVPEPRRGESPGRHAWQQVPGSGCTPSRPPGWRLDGSATPGDCGRWHPARVIELTGAAGPMEAVVYGGDAWLSAQHLVLALHGGPADSWRLEFDPVLQRMAAEGLAVVAPNQRGSSGYGLEHAMALHGAWGGPDLDDILVLLDAVAGQRAALGLEPPSLFGVSYGAFLALLTACHASDDQVTRCAVVAPFMSGARLLAEAAPPVRALTARLGGGEEIEDGRGPRDVLRLCRNIRTPLLVLHGDRDEVVPVSQSRALRHELLRIGRTEGTDFRYVEAAGAGHEVLAEVGAPVLHELLATFLRTGRPS